MNVLQVQQEQLDGGAVKVEANLQEKLSVHLHFTKLKYCGKRQVLKVIPHVALVLTVSEILKCHILA